MKRKSGVMFGVMSIPSEFGIGGFSKVVCDYLEGMKTMGFSLWQTLPLCPIGDRESPYDTICRRAGNYLFIDPVAMQEEGLLTADEVDSLRYHGEPYRVDYLHARWAKRRAIELGYCRITDEMRQAIDEFCKDNKEWLFDYALFMSIKEEDNRPFYLWHNDIKFRYPKKMLSLQQQYKERIDFYIFEQYLFYKQWAEIKSYANKIGVQIIGEMPFYSARDSVDVWVNPEEYQLTDELVPDMVAGLPPDYYSQNGRIWGAPTYNFDKMRVNGYKYLRKVIDHEVKMFDSLIFHHFRAYCEFYAIKSGDSALMGQWLEGPAMDLIERIKRKYPNYMFIADDLGITSKKVESFVRKSGFLSMRVMQFAFDEHDSYHLPHYYDSGIIGYTATKDTDTSLGWLYNTTEQVRQTALSYCNMHDSDWGTGGGNCKSNKAIIRTLIASSCLVAMIPLQDIYGFGGDTRLNNPAVNEDNYRFRITYADTENVATFFYKEVNELYGRSE